MTFDSMADVRPAVTTVAPGVDSWLSSRSGARSGRGFHYQDVVGAWLMARLLSGTLNASRVVPEGYEDLSCEGNEPWQVQVKSRQERVGDFTFREVALFLAEMWEKHLARESPSSDIALLALVLEQPVYGVHFDEWGTSIAAHSRGEVLTAALIQVAEERQWPEETVPRLMRSAIIFVLPWEEAAVELRREVLSVRDVYPVVADLIGRAFREAIANSVDQNAAVQSAEQSAGVDLSRAAGIVDEIIGLVDRAALEEAISDGLCEVVNYNGPADSSDFFEGVSAQPRHIAAGLPASRPDVVAAVEAGLDRSSAVLLTGPSGVGKSTALWLTAFAMRDVLWYRVRGLNADAVTRLIRLARASLPTARSKVGFVVDGIEVGSAGGWDRLLSEAALIPGVLVLGSVRTEDLLPIRTLADCVIVEVSLDEAVAERIFAKLKLTERTHAVHWREAFEGSNGLTLEYTYLLTRGRRLRDVLMDQIRRRVDEGRETELRLLALASTAHRWGATLRIDTLQAELGVEGGDFRSALGRLRDEHLILVGGDEVSGLHPLRSSFLSSGVHNFPPPTLPQTLKLLVKTIGTSFLSGVIVGALTDFPDFEPDVLRCARDRIREQPTPEILTAVLSGLRIADFQRKSQLWIGVMDRHNVSLPLRPVAFQLAMLDDSEGFNFKPGLGEAIAEIKPSLNTYSQMCSDYVEAIGMDLVGEILGACSQAEQAIALMSVLSETAGTIDLSGTPWTATPIAGVFQASTAVDYGNLVEAARSIDVSLAIVLSEVAGGEASTIDRLMRHCKWLTEIRVVRDGDAPVVLARTLHISDELQGDADKSTRDLARVLLRCFAECESVDLQALRPGGHAVGILHHLTAHSTLKRQYDHSEHEVAWNRSRAAIALAAFSHSEQGRTERTAMAAEMVQCLADYVGDLAQVWITSRNRPADLRRLTTKRSRIRDLMQTMVPLEPGESSSGPKSNALANDDLHSLADGIAENFTTRLLQAGSNFAALAAFVGDSLRQFVRKVSQGEEWTLLDMTAPPGLTAIDATLVSMHAILSELAHGNTPVRRLSDAARAGRSESAAERAAEVARRAAENRHDRRWAGVRENLTGSGFSVEVFSQVHMTASATEWPPYQVAIKVNVQSVQDWTRRLEEIQATLAPSEGESYHPGLLVIPVVVGRPIVSLSRFVISAFLPGKSQWDDWAEQFSDPCETPFTDAMAKAHLALVELSGLALLSTMRETADLQTLAHEVQARFVKGMQAIASMEPRDPAVAAVLVYLTEVAGRVHVELDNVAAQLPVDEFLSATMTSGLMLNLNGAVSTQVDDFNAFSFVALLCLEYDIDPPTAGRLLSTLHSE
jgi:hypothetical protein